MSAYCMTGGNGVVWCNYKHLRDGKDHAGDVCHEVVVVSPEVGDESLERLTKGLVEAMYAAGQHSCAANGIHPDTVVTALRSLITPPKPEEPTGLGAVVEDTDGRLWVRWHPGDGAVWLGGDRRATYSWTAITAVKVLSKGWSE